MKQKTLTFKPTAKKRAKASPKKKKRNAWSESDSDAPLDEDDLMITKQVPQSPFVKRAAGKNQSLCWNFPQESEMDWPRFEYLHGYHFYYVNQISKTLDTIGNCRRLVFTVGLSQHMHEVTNLWKFEHNRSLKLRDFNERKTPLSHHFSSLGTRSCVLSDAWFRDLIFLKSEVSKSNLWKITSFSKTTSLQGELFLPFCYTINLSPLLVIKKVFLIIIILSNYQ